MIYAVDLRFLHRSFVGMERWMVAQLATGAVSITSLLLAVATTHWLNMKETCSSPETIDNITFMFNDTIISNAGMWKICMQSESSKSNIFTENPV